jgi:transcription elongation GreA/GreB family factor
VLLNIDKNIIIADVSAQLQQELTLALLAADNAHKAATDDQSVAETQYDTLAIEQSYLAEGQSRRVDEIRAAIKSLQSLKFEQVSNKTCVMMGSLVQVEQDIIKRHWFFIVPAAGGYRCQISHQGVSINITLITPQAPMGKALLNKELDDDVILSVGRNNIRDFITDIK